MPACDHCGKACEFPFHCTYCGGSYCSDCRLPPSHDCTNVERWKNRASRPAPGAGPEGVDNAPPFKKCHYCDVTPARIFTCPQCGHDFCSWHMRHEDHCPEKRPPGGTAIPVQPLRDRAAPPAQPAKPVKKPLDPKIIAGFLLLFALVVGAAFAAGIFQPPSGTPGPAATPAATVQDTPLPPATGTTPATTAVPAVPADPRPVSGTIVSGNILTGGYGELRIDNREGTGDAVVVLTRSGANNSLLAAYVRSGENCTVEEIPDGSYTIYVQYGSGWDPHKRQFENNLRYLRFEDLFRFTTLRTTTTTFTQKITDIRYSIYDISLYSIANGTAKTTSVARDGYPNL